MFKSAVVTVIVCLLTVTLACPSNYLQASESVCVIHQGRSSTFCEACQKCSKYGKARGDLVFLHGRNVELIRKVLPKGIALWGGLNGLLELGDGKTAEGWRDLDPRTPDFVSGPNQFRWARNEPDQGEPHLVYNSSTGEMWDNNGGPISFSRAIYCEYGGPLPKGDFKLKYQSNFPKKFPSIMNTDTRFKGCPSEVQARTKIECALRCSLDMTCRSSYFNSKEQKCVHMLHADSLIPVSIAVAADGWT
ncbi:PAN domain protein, partial [Opisthorchis viverrini]